MTKSMKLGPPRCSTRSLPLTASTVSRNSSAERRRRFARQLPEAMRVMDRDTQGAGQLPVAAGVARDPVVDGGDRVVRVAGGVVVLPEEAGLSRGI